MKTEDGQLFFSKLSFLILLRFENFTAIVAEAVFQLLNRVLEYPPPPAPAQNRWTVDSGQKIGQWPVHKKLDIGQWTKLNNGQCAKNRTLESSGQWTLNTRQYKNFIRIISSLCSFYKLRIYYFHENIQILIKFYYVL